MGLASNFVKSGFAAKWIGAVLAPKIRGGTRAAFSAEMIVG